MLRLIADHSINEIVLLNSLDDEQPYWPGKPNERIEFGPLCLELVDETVDMYEGIIIRDFKFENKKRPQDNRNITQWQFTAWEQNDSIKQLNVLIDLVKKHQKYVEKDRSVVIQCLDGTQRCGMYVAYSNALEMFQCTGSFDVAFAVKQVRSVRPQAFEEFNDLFAVYTWLLTSIKYDSQGIHYNEATFLKPQ